MLTSSSISTVPIPGKNTLVKRTGLYSNSNKFEPDTGDIGNTLSAPKNAFKDAFCAFTSSEKIDNTF